MTWANERLLKYLDDLVPQRPPEMQKMEVYAEEHDFPIIGPSAGYFCYLVAKLSGARRVFELGSGYGYSTAWFARAVQENGGGEVFHVVWDEQLSQRAQSHLGRLGFEDIVHYKVSEAVAALDDTPGPFDLIFNDIDKKGYPASIDVIETKLRRGGTLIIDNALWSGRVYDLENGDESTEAIREVTNRLAKSEEWVTSIVPIRDGLLIAQRQ